MKLFFLFLLLSLSVTTAHAQLRYSTFNTPMGKVSTTTWTPEPYRDYSRKAYVRTVGPQLPFTIVFQNDSVATVKGHFDLTEKPNVIVVGKGKKAKHILPSDTKAVSWIVPSDNAELFAIPSDSCWWTRATMGPISTYSRNGFRGIESAEAVQLHSGPLVGFTIENLRALIGETTDERLRKLLEKEKMFEAVERFNKLELANDDSEK